MWWDLPAYFVLPFVFVLGCCLGSFLNVCIHRFPAHARLRDQLRSLNSHRSGCPKCLSSIQWRDNIPLLGWLLLRGRCRNCRRPISWRYPLVELLTGVLFVALYVIEPFSLRSCPLLFSWFPMPALFSSVLLQFVFRLAGMSCTRRQGLYWASLPARSALRRHLFRRTG